MRVPPVELPELLEEPPDFEADTTRQRDPLNVTLFHPDGRLVALFVQEPRKNFDSPPILLDREKDLGPGVGVKGRDEGKLELSGNEVLRAGIVAVDGPV